MSKVDTHLTFTREQAKVLRLWGRESGDSMAATVRRLVREEFVRRVQRKPTRRSARTR